MSRLRHRVTITGQCVRRRTRFAVEPSIAASTGLCPCSPNAMRSTPGGLRFVQQFLVRDARAHDRLDVRQIGERPLQILARRLDHAGQILRHLEVLLVRQPLCVNHVQRAQLRPEPAREVVGDVQRVDRGR